MLRTSTICAAALAVVACSGTTKAPTPDKAPANTQPATAEQPATPPKTEDRGGLAVGSQAPAVELPAVNGSTFASAAALAKGPLVLVFYRGHW